MSSSPRNSLHKARPPHTGGRGGCPAEPRAGLPISALQIITTLMVLTFYFIFQTIVKRFPKLSKLARKYLTIPATSAESERTFSDAGWILNKRRKNLESAIIADLLLLHCNCREKLQERLQALKKNVGAANASRRKRSAAAP